MEAGSCVRMMVISSGLKSLMMTQGKRHHRVSSNYE